jgi:hypothetical protein
MRRHLSIALPQPTAYRPASTCHSIALIQPLISVIGVARQGCFLAWSATEVLAYTPTYYSRGVLIKRAIEDLNHQPNGLTQSRLEVT